MKIKYDQNSISSTYYNDEWVEILKLELQAVRDYITVCRRNHNRAIRNEPVYSYVPYVAENLVQFMNLYLKRKNFSCIKKLSRKDLESIGVAVQNLCDIRFFSYDKSENLKGLVLKYLRAVNSFSDAKTAVKEFTNMLIEAFEKEGISSYICQSMSSESIYISPDAGLLKMIRISAHRAFETESELKMPLHYNIVVMNGEDEFYHKNTSWNKDGYEAQLIEISRHHFKKIISNLVKEFRKDKTSKIAKMTRSVYYTVESSRMKNNDRFKKVSYVVY